jgi:hypothetical protein
MRAFTVTGQGETGGILLISVWKSTKSIAVESQVIRNIVGIIDIVIPHTAAPQRLTIPQHSGDLQAKAGASASASPSTVAENSLRRRRHGASSPGMVLCDFDALLGQWFLGRIKVGLNGHPIMSCKRAQRKCSH